MVMVGGSIDWTATLRAALAAARSCCRLCKLDIKL
jgi:hypothetical protein